MDIAQYLADLLADHDEVSIPGLGSIYKEKLPAGFNSDTQNFDPPAFRLSFREDGPADNLLSTYISEIKHISPVSAEFFASRFGEELKQKIAAEGKADLSPAGFLERDENGWKFTSDLEFEDYDNFGLRPMPERAPDEVTEQEAPVTPITELSSTEPETVESDTETAAGPEIPEAEIPEAEPTRVIALPEKAGYIDATQQSPEISPLFDRIVLRDKSTSWLTEIPEDYDVELKKRKIWIPITLWGLLIATAIGAIIYFWQPIVTTLQEATKKPDSIAISTSHSAPKSALDTLADSTTSPLPANDSTASKYANDSTLAKALAGKHLMVCSFSSTKDASQWITEKEPLNVPFRIIKTEPQVLVSVGPAYPDLKTLDKDLKAMENKVGKDLFAYTPK